MPSLSKHESLVSELFIICGCLKDIAEKTKGNTAKQIKEVQEKLEAACGKYFKVKKVSFG